MPRIEAHAKTVVIGHGTDIAIAELAALVRLATGYPVGWFTTPKSRLEHTT